jgi:hypothetical protein
VAHDDIDVLLTRLEDTPSRITAAVAGRTAAQLAAVPTDEEWSPLAVLAHMHASDDIMSPRIVAMLVREEPHLPAFDERRWCEVMRYAETDFHELVAGLRAKRADLLRALSRIKPRDWHRKGQHETRGQITVIDTIRLLAEHDAEHLIQLETLLT